MLAEVVLSSMGMRSVKLSLDLQTYCKLCVVVCDNRAILGNEKDASLHGTFLQGQWDDYQQERSQLEQLLSGYAGPQYWENIKKLLIAQCDGKDPSQQKLTAWLAPKGDDEMVPLVIQGMDYAFIEILKNSIDAVIKQYLDLAGDGLLEMLFELTIDDKVIVFSIRDNAGGFSDIQIDKFNESIQQNTYQFTVGSQYKEGAANFYLGKQHLGLAQLCKLIKAGVTLETGLVNNTLFQLINEDIKKEPMEASRLPANHRKLNKGAKLMFTSRLLETVPKRIYSPLPLLQLADLEGRKKKKTKQQLVLLESQASSESLDSSSVRFFDSLIPRKALSPLDIQSIDPNIVQALF